MIIESYSVIDENELVRASLNGDKKAFNEIVTPFSKDGCTYG